MNSASAPVQHGASPRRLRIGLALGSGSARGWAHVGVLRTLLAAGIRPDVVCGTSVGAIVGAAYATGQFDAFEDWVRGMDRRAVMSYMDLNLGGGMLKGERLVAAMHQRFDRCPMEELDIPFAAVATALRSGNEVWLREGSVSDAVRASFALPGVFTPVWLQGRLLVDGGLVNPVPVSLARALGADLVIAVDLNHDLLERWTRADPHQSGSGPDRTAGLQAASDSSWHSAWVQSLQDTLGSLWPRAGNGGTSGDETPPLPSLLSVMSESIQIMQVRITRSRMAGDPPEVAISPHLSHLALLDFHRADEAIAAGRAATEEVLPVLRGLGLGLPISSGPGAQASKIG